MLNSLKFFLNHPLYDYDKQKANLLKAIFPFCIIVHHLAKYNLPGIGIFNWIGIWVMYLFFAMSGYGLVISYINKPEYINGFLRRSLPKLFIPYLITFILFVIYRFIEGIDQIELFKAKGLFSFIPTSWFIYILALFYVFFFVVFKYVKTGIAIKVILTSALVIAYCIVAPYIGFAHWRYDKCPAFIVGMVFALANSSIKEKFVRWHAVIGVGILLGIMNLPLGHRLDPYIYSSIMFLLMFILQYRGGSSEHRYKLPQFYFPGNVYHPVYSDLFDYGLFGFRKIVRVNVYYGCCCFGFRYYNGLYNARCYKKIF